MRTTGLSALFAVAVVSAGCHGAVKKDFQAICDAPNLDAVKKVKASHPAIDAAQYNRVIAVELDKTVTSKDGKALVEIATREATPPATRAKMMRSLVADEGITTCAWADALEAQPAH